MTRTTFRQAGNHFTAVFTGHANAKRVNDSDLVCAAISALAQMLVQGVCEELERGNICKINTLKRDDRDGAVSVDVLATNDGFPNVLGLFSGAASGCALIAEKYPENVSLGRYFQAYSLQS